MNQTERINSALEELSQVCSNIQRITRALYEVRQDALADDIGDWATIINSAMCEIKDAQDKTLDEQYKNAREGSAALLQGILGGSIVQPEAKP